MVFVLNKKYLYTGLSHVNPRIYMGFSIFSVDKPVDNVDNFLAEKSLFCIIL